MIPTQLCSRLLFLSTLCVGLSVALAGSAAVAQDDAAASDAAASDAAGDKPATSDKEFEADKGTESIDTSAFSQEQQDRYTLFASKCSKCHTLARPINTDKTAEQWARYVKRMASKPKSNISPDQAKEVYLFLKFYQAEKDAASAGAAAGDQPEADQ